MNSASNGDSHRSSHGAPQSPRLIRGVLIATVFAVIVYAAFAIWADAESIQAELTQYAWPAFYAGLGLATLNYALRFVRWHYYLRVARVETVPVVESAVVFVAGFVMSVTPGKVGEVLKSALLYESRGIPVEKTAPIVIAERVTDLWAPVLLASIGSVALGASWIGPIVGAAMVFGLLAIVLIRPLGEGVIQLATRGPLARLREPLLRAYESARVLSQPIPLLVSTLIAVFSWGLECLAMFVTASGFAAAHLSITEATFAYASPIIVGAVAMLPGGLGVTEAGMVALIGEFAEVSPAIATAIAVLVRLETLWWAVVLGLIALAIHRRRYGKRA